MPMVTLAAAACTATASAPNLQDLRRQRHRTSCVLQMREELPSNAAAAAAAACCAVR
jgi:hypothetical protein